MRARITARSLSAALMLHECDHWAEAAVSLERKGGYATTPVVGHEQPATIAGDRNVARRSAACFTSVEERESAHSLVNCKGRHRAITPAAGFAELIDCVERTPLWMKGDKGGLVHSLRRCRFRQGATIAV